jgi:uncharacterized protein with HEPN domain
MPRPLWLILDEMLDHIEQARAFARHPTFNDYLQDRMAQRAVERCIEIISEASRHIPDDVKANHLQIPWREVAAIGNIFRHEYHNVAARIVWDTVQDELPALEHVVRAIKAELPERD